MAEQLARQEAFYRQELWMVQHTLNSLFRLIQRRGLHKNFPYDYLVVDTETSGGTHNQDLVCQIGHSLILDGKEVDRGGYWLDWTSHPQVDQRWLAERLLFTKRQVEYKEGVPTGKNYHVSYERMQKEGSDPVAILRQYADWFREIKANGQFFVMHNGYNFDVKFFENHFKSFLADDFRFGDWDLIDTGMIEKGASGAMTPWETDTIRSWSQRIYSQRMKGIFFNLDKHCVPKYGLDKKFGLNMDMAHDAGYDSWVTHLLFEHWKGMLEGAIASGNVPVQWKNLVAPI